MSENPKHYAGAQKVPFGDVPGIIEAELSLAMAEGGMKYGGYNYRQDPIRAGDYYAAVRRHLTEFWELGEDVDTTCGLSHLTKAMACLAGLRDAQINGMMIDDRPPAVSRTAWDHLANVANEMRAKYPEPKERVTEWPPEKSEIEVGATGATQALTYSDMVKIGDVYPSKPYAHWADLEQPYPLVRRDRG